MEEWSNSPCNAGEGTAGVLEQATVAPQRAMLKDEARCPKQKRIAVSRLRKLGAREVAFHDGGEDSFGPSVVAPTPFERARAFEAERLLLRRLPRVDRLRNLALTRAILPDALAKDVGYSANLLADRTIGTERNR